MKKYTFVILMSTILLCIAAFSSCESIEQFLENSLGTQEISNPNTEESDLSGQSCLHSFGDWNTVKQPTCNEEGNRIKICNKCAESEEEAIPQSSTHTIVIDAAVPASCKSTGLTEGSHCSICNKTLVAQTVVPATKNHKFVTSQSLEPYECSYCGLKVIEHGNADGSLSGGNNKVKYYVTGDLEKYKNFEIVVYGNGEMPNFGKNNSPMWQDYLNQAVKIEIGEGVTSIGKYAFYCPDSIISCNFVMSKTVKTIKSNAISLKIKTLVLGGGVETVEANALGNVDAIYIPKSVKKLYLDSLGNETYFYEGTLEEFYKILLYVYNRNVTVQEYISTLDESFISNIHVYLQAKNISDRSHYWR